MESKEILNTVLQDIENGNIAKYELAEAMINILISHTVFESETARQTATKIQELLKIVVEFSEAANQQKQDLRQKLEAEAENGNMNLLQYIVQE
jgi:hypothetical protein